MISLPLTSRELTVAGRREVTYWARVGVAGFAFVAIALLWMIEPATGDAVTPDVFARIGGSLFFIGQVVQALVVYAGALLLPVSVVQSEREQRTMELLLLADQRGWDIVLSKYVSCVLQLWLLIVSVMPVLAFASYFGGVDVPRVAMQTANFCVMAAAFTAIGMMCAAWARDTGRAYGAAALLFVFWVVDAWAIDFLLMTPVYGRAPTPEWWTALLNRFVSPFVLGPYVVHTFVMALVTVVICLGIAAWQLRNVIGLLDASADMPQRRSDREISESTLYTAFTWREQAPGAVWLAAFEFVIAFVFGLIPVLGWLLVGGLCIRKITGAIGRARKEGLLDDVLATPGGANDPYLQVVRAGLRLSAPSIGGGMFGAMVTSVFFLPLGLWAPLSVIPAGVWMNIAWTASLPASTRPLIPQHQEATAIGRVMVAMFLWVTPGVVAFFAIPAFVSSLFGVAVAMTCVACAVVWLIIYPFMWAHRQFQAFKERVHFLPIAEPSYAETLDFRAEGAGR